MPANGRDPGDELVLRRDNVWLLTSIATQDDANRNLPEIAKCLDLSAIVGFSAEPLIERVDLWQAFPCGYYCDEKHGHIDHPFCEENHNFDGSRWWGIVGGESGPKARRFHLEWAESLVAQCKAVNVPVFVKQIGANAGYDDKVCEDEYGSQYDFHPVSTRDKKGGDPSEWPADLRVREFPTPATV